MLLFDDMNIIEVEHGVMYLTCLYNYAQPLIRYRLSDRLTLQPPKEKEVPFTKAVGLLGRNEDVLWFEDGRGNREFLHPLAIEGFCIEGLKDYQFRQTTKDTFEMYAETEHGASREWIRQEMLRQMGEILTEKKLDYVQFYVNFVNEILPMAPGQYMLQKVAVGFLFGSLSSVATAWICFRFSWHNLGILLALILLSSFVAALMGLFIGKFSQGLMVGVVYIKILMLVFMAVPIVCALLGISGPLAVIFNIVPSKSAFEGIMALSAGDMRTAVKDVGILVFHCIGWFALYILIFPRRIHPQ